MEKTPKNSKKENLVSSEASKTKPASGIAAESVFDKLKRQLRTSAILGMGGLSLSAAGQSLEDPNKQADQEFLRNNKKTEVVVDTIKQDGKTYIKKEIYGEKITDPELAHSASSLDEIRTKYINREVRAYESVVINSRFKKLRESPEFKKFTKEETIQYGDKVITVRLFKEGYGEELIKYLKKAYGPNEAERIIAEWGINEESYETQGNLKRDQFVRGIVHGQNKEHSRWVYLAGGSGNEGTPFIGIVGTLPDGTKDIFMEGLAECGGNVVFERVSVPCEDIKSHNSEVLYKAF